MTVKVPVSLAKELSRELDYQILYELSHERLEEKKWIKVMTDTHWDFITDEWRKENLAGQYRCFGYYWYFESKDDAAMFTLRWV